MQSAIDLFRAGAPVQALEMDHASVSVMRTVCPTCLERVHLVVRETTSYFAHQPWSIGSPPCPLRTEPWGSPATHGDSRPHEPLPPSTRFRDALLAAYSLSEPPEAAPDGLDVATAAALLHRLHQESGRTVTAADLPGISPFVADRWTTDEALVRDFLERPGVVSSRLRADLRDSPVLGSEEHRRSVLLLWRHLHLAQVDDDLLLLLRVTSHLFRPGHLADLVVTALGVLSWVPWSELEPAVREHICEECGRTFILPAAEKPAGCSECTKACLCSECAIHCSGCGDILCEPCIYRNCPACGGVLCSTCWHFEWECNSCGTWYCEGGVDEELEEVGKVECDGCGEPFCDDCADEALEDWEGERLCDSCRDERQSAKEEDEEEGENGAS